jgi:hypothetical protein
MSGGGVDLVVNCYERTYRKVLIPGTFARIETENQRRFDCRTALVNNVDDRHDATERGRRMVDAGELDRVVFVDDCLAEAVVRTGVPSGELSWHLDWALVAVTLDGPPWVVHWDADVRLREPADWIGPALAVMERDPRILASNPNWEAATLERETLEDTNGFALGFGFSDQVFLARRSEIGAPIYGQRCIARWRFPYPDSFEARVDAHMRHAGRLRATHRQTVYEHPVRMGTAWPRRSVVDRLRAARNYWAIRGLRALPWVPPHLRGL